jgi:hypothetical protein
MYTCRGIKMSRGPFDISYLVVLFQKVGPGEKSISEKMVKYEVSSWGISPSPAAANHGRIT